MDRILLSGLEFFGRHGCKPAENQIGQKFLVDLEVECDLHEAGHSDNMSDTLDYVALYNVAREIVEGEPLKLLETVAQRIADGALQDDRVQAVWVRVRKPHIAVPGHVDYLGVEISREREDAGSDL